VAVVIAVVAEARRILKKKEKSYFCLFLVGHRFCQCWMLTEQFPELYLLQAQYAFHML
jgi:hypothetical protein